jgi:hypothetical protein
MTEPSSELREHVEMVSDNLLRRAASIPGIYDGVQTGVDGNAVRLIREQEPGSAPSNLYKPSLWLWAGRMGNRFSVGDYRQTSEGTRGIELDRVSSTGFILLDSKTGKVTHNNENTGGLTLTIDVSTASQRKLAARILEPLEEQVDQARINSGRPFTFEDIEWRGEPGLRDTELWERNLEVVRLLLESGGIPSKIIDNDDAHGVPAAYDFSGTTVEFLPRWGFYRVGDLELATPADADTLRADIAAAQHLATRTFVVQ